MNNKLTKKQRYIMYCVLLQESQDKIYKKDFKYGLCVLIYDILGKYKKIDISDSNYIKHFLPELSRILYNYSLSWQEHTVFSKNLEGWNERTKVLNQCIKQTENFQ